MTDADDNRRITALESRIEFMDTHGTRGIDGLRLQIATVDRDLGKLQGTVESMRAIVDKLRPQRAWPAVIAYVAIVIPMYALVIDLIARR